MKSIKTQSSFTSVKEQFKEEPAPEKLVNQLTKCQTQLKVEKNDIEKVWLANNVVSLKLLIDNICKKGKKTKKSQVLDQENEEDFDKEKKLDENSLMEQKLQQLKEFALLNSQTNEKFIQNWSVLQDKMDQIQQTLEQQEKTAYEELLLSYEIDSLHFLGKMLCNKKFLKSGNRFNPFHVIEEQFFELKQLATQYKNGLELNIEKVPEYCIGYLKAFKFVIFNFIRFALIFNKCTMIGINFNCKQQNMQFTFKISCVFDINEVNEDKGKIFKYVKEWKKCLENAKKLEHVIKNYKALVLGLGAAIQLLDGKIKNKMNNKQTKVRLQVDIKCDSEEEVVS